MLNTGTETFDAKEMELLEQARIALEAEDAAALAAAAAADAADAAAAGAPAPVVEAPAAALVAAPAAPAAAPTPVAAPVAQAPAAPTAAPTPSAAAPAAPAPAVERSESELKASLRAARFAEDRANKALKAREEELAELRKLVPAPKPISDKALESLREYHPEDAAVIERTLAENAELKGKLSTAAPASDNFVPESLPVEYQLVVDEHPDLSAWQRNPDQTLYDAAGAMNEALLATPRWANASIAERFAEVARLVKENAGAAPAASPKAAPAPATLSDAQRAIAAAAAAPARPPTIGDLRGGNSEATNPSPDFRALTKQGLSDEEIMARLPAY